MAGRTQDGRTSLCQGGWEPCWIPPNSAQQGAQHLQRPQSGRNCWRLFCAGSLPPYVCSGPLSRHRELLQHPQGGRPPCQGARGGARSWARHFRGSGVELTRLPSDPPHLLPLPAFKMAAKQEKIGKQRRPRPGPGRRKPGGQSGHQGRTGGEGRAGPLDS